MLELSRDPIRMTLALLGSVILMIIMGYGISLDVEHLNYAVLDRDQTTISRDYVINIAGSRYFTERPPVADYEELDRRMRSGELSMAIEIPPGFGRDVARGRPVADRRLDRRRHAAARRDDPRLRAGHARALADAEGVAAPSGAVAAGLATIELRYRYNPDVKSLVAMVPAVIPLLLLLIPAMLTTLTVVREKDLGSIINFYVTPTTRLEFLLGKQLPYVALGMLNFLLLTLLAVTLFRVPLKGAFSTLPPARCSTSAPPPRSGCSSRPSRAARSPPLFATADAHPDPRDAILGLTDPVSSLEGFGRSDRRDLPDHLLHHDLPRDLHQGAGLRRPVGVVHPPADRHPGADRAERCALKKQET